MKVRAKNLFAESVICFIMKSRYRLLFHLILSAVLVGITALLCVPLANAQSYHVVSFILLFLVSILSTFMSLGPVLLSSTLSALVWNFYFIPPQFTLKIEKTEDVLIFGLFFVIALVNGVLTTRVRMQERIAREREKKTDALFQLTKELSKTTGIDDVLKVSSEKINTYFNVKPVFLLSNRNDLLSDKPGLKRDANLSSIELEVAAWCFDHVKQAGAHTRYFSNLDYTFYPLVGTKLNPGVVAIVPTGMILYDQKAFWDTFLAQISNALEREYLGQLAQKVRFLDESDRLYKTLFSSISHELRIPVATIMGASDSIISSSTESGIQSSLGREIFTASQRLNRLIENLLNISRLESGHLSIRLDWHDINDLINKVIEELHEELMPFHLKIAVPEDMPLVMMDFGLMEQVLYNLIFNATQYAPGATAISLSVTYRAGEVLIDFRDFGPGFPETDLEKIFKKFYRSGSSKVGGLGLGLSIVKGFVEAHNGSISVENVAGGGAQFTIRLPSELPSMDLS